MRITQRNEEIQKKLREKKLGQMEMKTQAINKVENNIYAHASQMFERESATKFQLSESFENKIRSARVKNLISYSKNA